MKIFKLLITAILTSAVFLSCQKELKFDANGTSSGTLKKDGSDNCTPVTVNGIFKADSVLNASHFVDVQVNVSVPGTFEIKSDTINGYSFRKVGSVVFGINTIRLYASGKPLLPGTNRFTIKYGTSTCIFEITVIAAGSSGAVYTIGGAPGLCTGAMAGGTYVAGVPLAPSNTLTIQVNVAVLGYYSISAITANGFSFTGSGVFTGSLGLQNVVLTGIGTPVVAGNTIVTVTNLATSCTYSVTVQAGSGGGGSGNYYLQFNDGANVIAADPAGIQALIVPNGGFMLLSVQGFSITGDSALSVSVASTGTPVTATNYSTSNIGVPLGVFNVISTANGQVYQADLTTLTVNTVIKFDVIDITNKIVSGTFSGTAQGASGIRTITNGKFRAPLP